MLEDVIVTPETPKSNETFSARGKIRLADMPFILPTWVICSITGPGERRESSIAVGGTFDVKFAGGLLSEGSYKLETKLYIGPTASLDKTIFPPFPAIDTYTSAFTVSGVAPPPSVCTPGETKCVGYDLYTCGSDEKWHLTARNSAVCGYVPPPPPPGKATLYGIVTNFETKEPIKDVTARADLVETKTDSDGYYELTNLEPYKTYYCAWRKLDYHPYTATLTLSSEERKEYNVSLIPIPPPVPEVTIDKITPDPCWRGGTISIIGRGFSTYWNWIHLWKAITHYPSFTVIPTTTTATKLTLNLGKIVNESSIGEALGPGRVMVQIEVVPGPGEEHLWSNVIGFEMR